MKEIIPDQSESAITSISHGEEFEFSLYDLNFHFELYLILFLIVVIDIPICQRAFYLQCSSLSQYFHSWFYPGASELAALLARK
jgi:hypothetical protein